MGRIMNMVGYITLTLYKSESTVFVKSSHISTFYRKKDSDHTVVHTDGTSEHLNVKETPTQIIELINELHPDLR